VDAGANVALTSIDGGRARLATAVIWLERCIEARDVDLMPHRRERASWMPTRQPLAVVSSNSRCPILAGRGERAAQGQFERESGELCLLSRLD
jgi:hypothetical protein